MLGGGVRFPYGLLTPTVDRVVEPGRHATLRTLCPRGRGSSNLPLVTPVAGRTVTAEYANPEKRPSREGGDFVGSTPTSATGATAPATEGSRIRLAGPRC